MNPRPTDGSTYYDGRRLPAVVAQVAPSDIRDARELVGTWRSNAR